MTYQGTTVLFPQGFIVRTVESPQGSGNYVRLQDDARKCVVYLGVGDPKAPEVFDPVGTAFLVGVPDGTIYLVTADHVAKEVGDGGFCIRLNRADTGLGQLHLIEHANWIRHPSDPLHVDLAVMEFPRPDWAAITFFPSQGFLTDFKMGTKAIGPGDLTYVVGIFEPLYGKRRNMPAVHTGHIALIPEDEKLPVLDWNHPTPETAPRIEVDAYLVQVQNTLPGVSGAPVFVRRSLGGKIIWPEIDRNPNGIEAWMHGSLWLLGIWTDAWLGHPDKILRPPRSGKHVIVPAGMGAVVPVRKLIETLEHPNLIARRKETQEKKNAARAPIKTGQPTVASIRDKMLHTMLSTPPQPRKRSSHKRVKSK